MKRVILLLFAFIVVASCKNGNNAPKRILSDTPIKTEVMGIKLCEESNENFIKNAISKEVGKKVLSDSQNTGGGTMVRVAPITLELTFGGFSWHYVDVTLAEDSRVVGIAFVGSYESLERAKEQFEAVQRIYEQKYGEGNKNDEKHLVFWTDDTNSVLLNFDESSAINGSDRCFCTLCYVNNELAEALEKANTSDI